MTTHTIVYAWRTPPLTANQRLFWAAKADITRTARRLTATLAQNADIPPMAKCEVQLTWYVTDNRRRDTDNLYPTFKVCCDALVDAGVVPDDTPQYMTKAAPQIIRVDEGQPHLTLTVTELEAVPA